MLIGALLAAAIAVGVPPPLVAVGALAAWHPVPAILALVAVVVRQRRTNRRRRGDDEVAALLALGSELRAGASLRFALASIAVRRHGEPWRSAGRRALAGAPMETMRSDLVEALPRNGAMVAMACSLGERTGARLAPLIGRIVESAERRAELDRERIAATAQARLSTVVVGLAPLAFTGFLVAVGAVPAPWQASGTLAVVSAAGLVLEVSGFSVVVAMMRRHVW